MAKDVIPEKFGKFEILDKLGQGGMGTVYKARDPGIGRVVALKTLNPDLLSDPKLLERFAKEARAAGQLDHPNVITIHGIDLGESGGPPFIVMEFIEGESLQTIIDRRADLSLARKLQIIIQFCRGLDHAHKHGLVHRDVKPANILVKSDGKVKVVDFGIVHMESTTMTKTGVFMGTIQYASPEQVEGQHPDARSDLFSVGVVIYELLSYQKPFDGKTIGAVINQILNKEAIPLNQVAEGIPPELEVLVHKCLRKQPEARFQSLEELLIELEPIELGLQHTLVADMVGQGSELLSQGDLAQAQKVLRSALVLDSTNTKARDLMQRVNSEIKKLEASTHVRQYLNEGELYLRQGEYEEAIRALEQVLKLDSQHGQARELIDKARVEKLRATEVRKALAAGRNAYKEGDSTGAEVQLRKVLELDGKNAVAENLLTQIQQERAARERRVRLKEVAWQADNLINQEHYEEALNLLEGVQQEFPDEQDLQQLTDTARKGAEKRRLVQNEIDAIQTLILEGKIKQAVDRAEELCIEHPEEPGFLKIYQDAKIQQESSEREQRYREELASIQKLIIAADFDPAIQRATRLQKEFLPSPEIESLLAQARGEKELAEQRRLSAISVSVQKLLGAQKFEEAIREAQGAAREFPGNPEIESLLGTARAGLEEIQKQGAQQRNEQRRRTELAGLEDETRRSEAQRQLQEQLRQQKERPPEERRQRPRPAPQEAPQQKERTERLEGQAQQPVSGSPPQASESVTEKIIAPVEAAAPLDPQLSGMTLSRRTQQAIPPEVASTGTTPGVVPAAGLPSAVPPTVKRVSSVPQEKPLSELESQPVPDVSSIGLPSPVAPPLPEKPTRLTPAAPPAPKVKPRPEPKRAAAPVVEPPPKVAPAPPAVKPKPAVEPHRVIPPAVVAPKPAASKMPMIIGAAAVVLIVVGIAVWKFTSKPTVTIPGQPSGASEALQKLQTEAQEFENQHELARSLEDWKKLAAEPGSLQDDATRAAARVQGQIDQAQSALKDAKDAENAKKYDDAKADYKKAEQIDAGLKTQAETGISNAEASIAGKTPEQVEQASYDRGSRLFKTGEYKSAQAAFQSVIDRNLAGSKNVPKARDQLTKITALVQDQQKFEDAKARFKPENYDAVKLVFDDLVSRNSPYKQQAQGYLNQINQAKKAEADRIAASKAKEDQDKQAALKAEADRLAKLKEDADRLAKTKEDADRNAKQQEADRIAKQEAADRLAKTKEDADRLAKAKEPEKPPSTQTKEPVVSLVPANHVQLTSPFNSNQAYELGSLDPGFKVEHLPSMANVSGSSGSTVMLKLEVSPDGQVTKLSRCITPGGQERCQAIAAAPGWKFSSPTINNQPAKAIATVKVQF